jgi:cytochrome b subunit of formate dehydrogenase
MIASVGGFDNRTFIHHYAGLVMIGVAAYHVIYHTILEKPRFDILFNPKDINDFLQQVRYYYKLTDVKAKFGRYTWKQKFEYFGAGFGAVIMGFTGILMWHPFEAMRYFPLSVIQIANLFHTWEAVLASLAIFIGHFYFEHLNKFPNMSWLTGKISEEEMREEHSLEYEMIDIKNSSVTEIKDKSLIKIIALKFGKIIFTIVFLVIFVWMLWISYTVMVGAINTYFLS